MMQSDRSPNDLLNSPSATSPSTSHQASPRTASIHTQDDRIGDAEKGLSGPPSGLLYPEVSRQATSVRTNATDPAFEVDWEGEDDPMNPHNWSVWFRGVIVFLMSFSTWVVVLYSTSYTSGIPQLNEEFHIQSEIISTLGLTTYLMGLAIGAVVCAPLSEVYGRRPVYIISMFIFTVLLLPCALATSIAQILAWRFVGGLAGSVMIANAPGSVADIVNDEYRAFAFSMWSMGPMLGPIWGPVIGGFVVQYLGWRWTNWLVLIVAGTAWISLVCVRETYSPAILRRKAKRRRQETGDNRWHSRYDDKLDLWPLLKLYLSRPFVMTFTEPICQFWCLYIGVVYGILYLCFVAYPIVFSQIRGWTPGLAGLSFLGIGVGSFLAIGLEPLIRRLINGHKIDPETGRVPPEAMVSVICVAAILSPLGEIWFAWTCVPADLHWIWCVLAGVPFGAGNTIIFIYATNYLANSYGIYAASALAGSTVVRSLMGGLLPLAGSALYSNLGPQWAGTLLGLLEVMLIPIPFVFYKYGHRIRLRSALIQSMQRDKERLAGKRARQAQRSEGVTKEP